MTRFDDAFRPRASRGALLPYLTAGFPDLDLTRELILRLDALGAAVIELGLPFSDSIADGPIIQASFHEALRRGFRVDDGLQLVADLRHRVRCPLVAMLSYSLVHRMGTDVFLDRASAAGFDGVILPDLPFEEADSVVGAAQARNLAAIPLIAPTTSAARRERIAGCAAGFIYQIAVAGTTGERGELPSGLTDQVAAIRGISPLPVCIGFGISSPAQVRAVCRIADGAIVGSAIVRTIDRAGRSGKTGSRVVDDVGDFVAGLVSAASGNP
jgi:tryptophan synthase alpha chain